MANLEIMPDSSEVVRHDTPGIGLYIRRGQLSDFPDHRATCHWHNDLEFIHILSGEMDYAIDGDTVSLREGDSLFVNSRRLHYGFGPQHGECAFLCILVESSLLTANERLYRELLAPFVSPDGPAWYVERSGGRGRLGEHLQAVWRLKEGGGRSYPLRAVAELLTAVTELLDTETVSPVGNAAADPSLAAVKKMVAFIQLHFTEPLTLDAIAGSAAVSRSTCCRLFRSYVHTSPGQFLTDYRLRVSRDLLVRTPRPVTEIAAASGFDDPAYFTRQFRSRYGCTPRDYRKTHPAEA